METISKTTLSVNINKIATIRNARGGNLPDLIAFAKDCERFGAEGITVHPRPDERHIRYQDVHDLKQVVRTEFKIEGYPTASFIELVKKVKPTQCTLVPDAPEVLTSNQGWDLNLQSNFLVPIIKDLKQLGIRVSLFIDPNPKMVVFSKEIGADRVELYTGHYAEAFNKEDFESLIEPYRLCANQAKAYGLGLNAGHDLNLENLARFKKALPNLLEVSIGHALISDSLYFGIENTIALYKNALK